MSRYSRTPLEQCLRQERLLKAFLQLHNLPSNFPVLSRVVFTSNKTILSVSESCKEVVRDRVIRKEAVVSKIHQLNKAHRGESISGREMYRLAHIINDNHTPAWFSPLKRYELTVEQLKHLKYTFVREANHVYWRCPHCGNQDRRPYVQSLQEYAMPCKPMITNQEARRFLQIDDRFYVQQALKAVSVKQQGTKRAAKYLLQLPTT